MRHPESQPSDGQGHLTQSGLSEERDTKREVEGVVDQAVCRSPTSARKIIVETAAEWHPRLRRKRHSRVYRGRQNPENQSRPQHSKGVDPDCVQFFRVDPSLIRESTSVQKCTFCSTGVDLQIVKESTLDELESTPAKENQSRPQHSKGVDPDCVQFFRVDPSLIRESTSVQKCTFCSTGVDLQIVKESTLDELESTPAKKVEYNAEKENEKKALAEVKGKISTATEEGKVWKAIDNPVVNKVQESSKEKETLEMTIGELDGYLLQSKERCGELENR
ncbi:hypothetical protein Taro_020364 [Colocasia esculenta]|uniref:Uncharacterized protein n=1 Tax=Colocasia esculenta TaxID=4460 RepID=A0A843UYL8_COLES|nr:hypothetical protein [Colocasia esculenta]